MADKRTTMPLEPLSMSKQDEDPTVVLIRALEAIYQEIGTITANHIAALGGGC
jgi:hypothetical protein